jgi:hypothetical protein
LAVGLVEIDLACPGQVEPWLVRVGRKGKVLDSVKRPRGKLLPVLDGNVVGLDNQNSVGAVGNDHVDEFVDERVVRVVDDGKGALEHAAQPLLGLLGDSYVGPELGV